MTVEILGHAARAGLRIPGENLEILFRNPAARLCARMIPENVIGTY